jgi:hypothetical protein
MSLTDHGVPRSFTLPGSEQNQPDHNQNHWRSLDNPIGAMDEQAPLNDDAERCAEETVGKVFASEFPLTHFFFFAGAFFPFSGGFTPINARTASSNGMLSAGSSGSFFVVIGFGTRFGLYP